MRILVIDDSENHRESAIENLVDHKITVIASFDGAMEIMREMIDEKKVSRLLKEGGFPDEVSSNMSDEEMNSFMDAVRDAEKKSVIPFEFEVVLTDMMMPMSKVELLPEFYKPGEQMPYGLIIALRAALRGAKFVAMITDSNHHHGAMSAAIDHIDHNNLHYYGNFTPGFVINGARVMFMHAFLDKKGRKDWSHALSDLIRC